MVARPAPVRWGLILLVVGLVGLGAALVVWGLPLVTGSSSGDLAPTKRVPATVVAPVACGSDARDGIEIRVDGLPMRAKLDACGSREGEQLQVEVPQKLPAVTENLVVQVVGTGQAGSGLGQRLRAVLCTVAGVAGAIYALLLAGYGRRRTVTEQPA
ncbi:hypothetical protein GCM10022247_65520 [Allokutzneria multivorans]|uniref:Integral membrane protein n=1 Tax=Allokutzneria multivorans TaxID=1142134 RepID=A0ABP7TUN8_9PSEU